MLRYLVKRILILIPVIILISVILFTITKLMPGDPVRAMLPLTLRPDQYERAYHEMYLRLGLDRSVVEQYFRWMYNVVFMGEYGTSSLLNRPVSEAIGVPLRNTLIMNMFVNFFYLVIALPVSIRMAVKRGSFFDNSIQVTSLATYSVPSFFLGLLLIFLFAVRLAWLPMGGMPNTIMLGTWDTIVSWARHLTLPVMTLTLISLASAIRYFRNAMIDGGTQDYITTARSRVRSEKVDK